MMPVRAMTSSSCACAKTKRLEARGNHEPQMVLHQDPQRGRHDEKKTPPPQERTPPSMKPSKQDCRRSPRSQSHLEPTAAGIGDEGDQGNYAGRRQKSRTPPKNADNLGKTGCRQSPPLPYWNIRMNCRQRPSSSLKKSRTETTPRKSWTS